MVGPVSVQPYNQWLGNDGNWSTIQVQIGTPPHLVNLLPATSVSTIWPIDSQGCLISSDPTLISDPVNCPELRGGLFSSASVNDSSFQAVAASNGDGYLYLPFSKSQQSQGYNGTAIVGTDTVVLTLKSGTPKLSGQTVASNLDVLPYLGMFGLTGYASHVNSTSQADTTKAPLQALKDGGTTSAYSYGYTAGRYYTAEPELLSLTFGGYDANRGAVTEDKAISATFGDDWQRDLVVVITGINIGGASVEGLDGGIHNVFIDSLIPEIWLPESTCQAFERAFNLVWNETLQYYLVNSSQHDQMLEDGKTVTFTLAGNKTEGAPTVDIEMPYNAFDQALQYPLAGIEDASTSYRYFPLKRASGSGQYTLGRTFLQEAYLTADYGNSRFYVSKAKPLDGTALDLRCIGCKKSGLSTGAIVGIAVAAAVVGLMIAAFFFWRWKKKRDIRKLLAELQVTSRASIGGTTIQDDDPHNVEFFKATIPAEEEVKPELDGSAAVPAGFVQYGRHELASNGSVRRTSQQSGLSRGTISPISGRMPSHARNLSYGSSDGQPSPSAGDSPSLGQGVWGVSPHGSPDPEMREVRHHSGGQWYFELPANPRSPQSQRPALDVIQSTNAAPAEPPEVRADPRSPVVPESESRFREDLRE